MDSFRVELTKAFPRLEWDLVEFDDGTIHAESFIGVFRLEVRYRGDDRNAVGQIDVPASSGRRVVLFQYGVIRLSSLKVVLYKMGLYVEELKYQVDVMCGEAVTPWRNGKPDAKSRPRLEKYT